MTFSKEEDGGTPSGKRQKTSNATDTDSNTTKAEDVTDSQASLPGENVAGLELQDDDDDDFLAREMAEGGDTDDSDDSDE